MPEIHVSYIMHDKQKRIRLQFENYGKINGLLRHITGARWSRTLKSWHMPCDCQAYLTFKKNLPQGWQIIERKNDVDLKVLNDNMEKLLQNKNSTASADDPSPALQNAIARPVNNHSRIINSPINPANARALQQYLQCLQLKAYSPSTIKTYKSEFVTFLQTLKNTNAASFTAQRIKDYLQYCHRTLRLSENTIHSRMNALKFYYEQVLHREKLFWEIPRPKKQLILPKVLSEDELGRLFNSLINIKHKAILFTAYSAGLRVSEVVSLKIKDIDSSRMQLLIENAKGKKDRYVNLSILLLDVLRAYIKNCKPRPVVYLFEGQEQGMPYTTRSAQMVFQNAKDKAGIKKDVGIHSLRHSFATHLLEKGVDIKYIKDFLGHFNIKTTERYLHVAKEKLITITSPLDDLYKKGTIEW